jgi:hypothetical protein
LKTDPVSAATGYRQALDRILNVTTLQEARKLAVQALDISFDRPSAEVEIAVASGFGANTQQPFVTLSISDPTVQLPAAVARKHAMSILEACDAAESDGFLVTFMRDRIGLEPPQFASLLDEFRRYRAQRSGEPE